MTPRNNKSDSLLNVHAVVDVSYANGPGSRTVVWTQGCSRRCPGCSNPTTHSHKSRIMVDPQQLAEFVITVDGIEGITVTGGELYSYS